MGAQRSLRAPVQRRTAHARTRRPSCATGGASARHAVYEMGPRPPLEQGRTPDAEHDQRTRGEHRGGRRDVGQRQGEETLRRRRAGVRTHTHHTSLFLSHSPENRPHRGTLSLPPLFFYIYQVLRMAQEGHAARSPFYAA